MIKLILILIAIWVLYTVKHRCIQHNRICINHVFCMMIGYVFYYLFPLFAFEFNLPPIGGIWFNDLNQIYQTLSIKTKLYYILCSYLWMLLFVMAGKRKTRKRYSFILIKQKDKYPFLFTESLFYILFIILGLFFAWQNRNYLFKFYKDFSPYQSSLTAYIYALFSACMLIYYSTGENLKKTLLSKWGIAYLGFIIIQLSTGGRMTFITNVIAVIIARSYLNNKPASEKGIKIRKIVPLAIIAIVGLGIFGMWRIGGGISFKGMLDNVLGESIAVNYSLYSYLDGGEAINIISYPKVFFSSIINLVPSAIWPGKIQYLVTVQDINTSILSPGGAMHNFVSFNADGGFILSSVFFYCLGRFLNRLEGSEKVLSKTMYCMVSALLALSFFRDPIESMLIKCMFEFAILIPAIVYFANKLLVRNSQQMK